MGKNFKYLGIVMQSSRLFKCVFDSSKKSLYKSFNAIFGKIGHSATTDIVICLLTVKCLPVLLHGLNACPLSVTETNLLTSSSSDHLQNFVYLLPSYY